jgi:hypothetical protein
MAFVIVRAALGLAGLHRKNRLTASALGEEPGTPADRTAC